MKRSCLVIAAIFLACTVALSARQTALQTVAFPAFEEQLKEGVVISHIAKNSAGEKASISEGDIILRWTRDDAAGKVVTPLDLSWIEIEEGPRGRVTLEGLRNDQRVTFQLEPGDWGVTSRPNFQRRLLSVYEEGQDLAKAGKLPGAIERWRTGADQAQDSQHWWVSSWLLLQSADALADARLWKEADNAYQAALDAARGPVEISQILSRRGRAFQQQHDWNQAEKYYRLALAEGEKLKSESLFIARCLNNLGGLFGRRGDLDKAEGQFVRALAIRQKLAPDSLDVAASLDNLAIVEGQRGNLGKAEEYSRKVITITEKLAPESIDLAISLNNLGYIMIQKGDTDAAAPVFQRALVLEERLEPETIATASTLTNLGRIARQQGSLNKAEEYHRRSLEIRQKASPGGLEHSAGLNNLAMIHVERGDLIEAEKLYLQAIAILEKIAPASSEMAMSLTNLGGLDRFRGNLDMAGEHFSRALVIMEKSAPAGLHVAGLLGNLGSVAQDQGNPIRAREYFLRSLSINEKVAPASLDTALALNKLGSLEQEEKNDKQAKEYYKRALQIEEMVAPRGALAALSLSGLGELAIRDNDLSQAEANYRRALEIRERLSSEHTEYAESLASLASLLRRKGQVDEAGKLFAQALGVLEDQISLLGGGQEVSSNFRAKHVDYYKEYIDLLIQQKQPDLAFQVLERLRARELLKILVTHLDFGKGEVSSLLAQRRSLAADIAAKSSRRNSLSGNKNAEVQILALDREIRELETQFGNVNSEIRKNNRDYKSLTEPRLLSLKEVQEHLLDADTALLEYDLSEERSYLWLVTSDSRAVYELAKRSDIEAAARKLRNILIARNEVNKYETDSDPLSRSRQADAQYPAVAAELGRMILGPIASSIGHKRLLVVSDGILQYIPFDVLTVQDPPAGVSWPLIHDHEIVTLPSASVLAMLKGQIAGTTAAMKTIAVLADPVFDANDARIQPSQKLRKALHGEEPTSRGAEDTPPSDLLSKSLMLRSASDVGAIQGGSFPRLFFARAEAEAILQGIPTGQRLKALDFNASRATAMSEQLRNYRILHFATHGLLNSEHPELSGLVLSLVDKQGKQQNGFLSLKDIYGLNLRADLVVLSACETGLGKDVQGEGLVGIARGFMYAGASSVVASLWKVDDLATGEFMKVFYKGMLNDKLRPAAALRRAQIAMSKRRAAPYFWAGFVLQGRP
jgi:CHAT domain-containing protein/Tfp pilus assembly protein PilF